jgi:hypothetical protein
MAFGAKFPYRRDPALVKLARMLEHVGQTIEFSLKALIPSQTLWLHGQLPLILRLLMGAV